MTGSCPAPEPIVEVPPFAGPPAPDPALVPAWPTRICALATSGVPAALRVESCNCGEHLSCRVRGATVTVSEDPRTHGACDDCVQATTRCAVLEPLTPGHATLRVNDAVDVRIETDATGTPIADGCWNVRSPPAHRGR
jgi:hypothetical protein